MYRLSLSSLPQTDLLHLLCTNFTPALCVPKQAGRKLADLAGPASSHCSHSRKLQMALKCADLGHLSAGREVHAKWVGLLQEEFFCQGDREREHGLPISPLMDRSKPGITKSQVR